jgi:hypothetical protein
MKILLFSVSLLLATDCISEELKVYTPNEAGGHIVLTQETCQIEKYIELYPYRGYATTSNPDDLYEACYVVPDISEAPQIPGYKVFPLVNFIDEDGIRLEYPLEIFSSTPQEPDIGLTI